MKRERWKQVDELLDAALELPLDQRAAFLNEVCSGDKELRKQLDALLASDDGVSSFLEQPALDVAAKALADKKDSMLGQSIGHYKIISRLGAGGMGEVYLAKDTKLDRKVALKLLPPGLAADRNRMQRFVQEAKAASALNHPNILTIHEVSEIDGQRFMATEFIDGMTLRQRLSSPVDVEEALGIAIQISSALAAAHKVHIVHRDIKPENIMIRNDDGLVKVLDFGLAKMIERRQTVDSAIDTALIANTGPGVVMGTVAYMSPEQARGDKVDERTDIWSLGVMLYEMIAGCSPFVAGSSNEIISAVLSRQPAPPLTRYAHHVPERLQEIIEKALTKNRDERYQTSKDLLIDLKRLKQTLETKAAVERSTSPETTAVPSSREITTQGAPSNIQSTSSAEYIVSQIKRHKLGAMVAVAIAILLTIVSGVLIYTWRLRESAVSSQPDIKSLAVLPLKPFDPGENYLGLGIADAVIRRISQTGQLIVRPTSAVRRYSNEDIDALSAAKQLGVDSVLEGTVQRTQDRLRVSVNLLRTSDSSSLWTESFDMPSADIFTIQDTISQQVASRLRLKLSSGEKERFEKRYTSNAEAYEYFVKGRTNFERVSTAIGDREPAETAIGYFKKAVELDSKYALAYAALGQAYMWMANFNDPDNPVWVGLAQRALSQAESFDPQLADIHEARFQYYFSNYGGWDLSKAASEARQALALDPNLPAGHTDIGTIYDHLGLDEATGLRENQRALEIDPTNTATQWRLVQSYSLYSKFDEAIELHLRFFGSPGDVDALIGKGRLDEAKSLLEESVRKTPGDLWSTSRLALISALKGKSEDAESALPTIIEQARNNRAYHHIIYNIACVYALDGKTDEAVKWLRTTAETGMPNYPRFARDPHLDRIRKDTAFIQFMTELKSKWDGYKQEFE
jgi:eukaryotic-like serine/threonine-protein kinase